MNKAQKLAQQQNQFDKQKQECKENGCNYPNKMGQPPNPNCCHEIKRFIQGMKESDISKRHQREAERDSNIFSKPARDKVRDWVQTTENGIDQLNRELE
jgi:hypothetical protein